MTMDVKIEDSWKEVLKQEFSKPYFQQIAHHIKTEKSQNKILYPSGSNIFNAFNSTPFDKVKVVVLGQDPYHGHGQAHGLSFSVPAGVSAPPSLKNIFKEIREDLNLPIPASGNLEKWAKQGVLLLNATLTVGASSPGSHQKKGWEEFTDAVVKVLNDKKEGLVFLLWGAYAQQKCILV